MNIDAKYHPTPEQLEGFAQGTLSPGMNVVISAHVELCAICRKSVSELEEAASEEWLRSTPDRRASSINFSAMIDSIVDHPQIKGDRTTADSVSEIHMLDHSVTLPRALARLLRTVWSGDSSPAASIRQL